MILVWVPPEEFETRPRAKVVVLGGARHNSKTMEN